MSDPMPLPNGAINGAAPGLRLVSDDPVESLREDVAGQFQHVHARLDRVEEAQTTHMQMTVQAIAGSVEAIKAANKRTTTTWVAIVVALIGAAGVIIAAAMKAHG